MLRRSSALFLLLCSTLAAFAQDQYDKALLMDYFQEQQYDKVIAYMEGTVKPVHVNGLALLANAYLQNGQTADAERTYQLVLDKDSNHIAARQQLGNIARAQQQYAKAVTHYSKLVALRPDNALYYKQLALAASNTSGLQDTAFALMKISYNLNRKDPSVVTFLAEEYFDRKDYASADTVLKQYYLTDSANTLVTAALVKSSYQQKNFQEAVNYGESLLAVNAVHPVAYLYLAVSHYSLDHFDSTIRVHDKMVEFARDAPETLKYYAALSYAQLKQFDKSNELLQECITAAKSRSLDSYYTALANNYEQMKQYRQAISHYDTAYFLFKDPMRQYGIARIYDQYVQDPLKAKRYYQLFLKNSKPESKDEKSIQAYAKERVKSL
ncbi:tetratricopeptide repeat protein [Chitinophaga sp. YIM B06452]|uniref:tetratricopeptide repeat protein n=1 Tax=Chitinophaga sp. YIM B06452 TaxID=3082158 RepID=UPI0031FE9778